MGLFVLEGTLVLGTQDVRPDLLLSLRLGTVTRSGYATSKLLIAPFVYTYFSLSDTSPCSFLQKCAWGLGLLQGLVHSALSGDHLPFCSTMEMWSPTCCSGIYHYVVCWENLFEYMALRRTLAFHHKRSHIFESIYCRIYAVLLVVSE